MVIKSASVLAVTLLATPVFAAETQPYQQGVTQFAYEQNVGNFCPAGLQPIRYNGVICCGQPNATGYRDAPVVRRKSSPKPKMSYAPERIPLGKSPNSYDGT